MLCCDIISGRRSNSCKPTPYARRHGSGSISTSAKSLPQSIITRNISIEQEDAEEERPLSSTNTTKELLPPSNSLYPRRYSRTNAPKRPPFKKAMSLDCDDSRNTYTISNSSSKQTTVHIEIENDDTDDTMDEEDENDEVLEIPEVRIPEVREVPEEEATSDEGFMVSAKSEIRQMRIRTVSTVSECSEFSTCH